MFKTKQLSFFFSTKMKECFPFSSGLFFQRIVIYFVLKSKIITLEAAICIPVTHGQIITCVTIMCHNDELSSTMCRVCCLLKDSELFTLFAEKSQILLKIYVIPKRFLYNAWVRSKKFLKPSLFLI